MKFKRLLSICLLFTSFTSYSQVTTFKDSRWFDYKTNTSSFYRKPNNQPAEVRVTADSLIATLGSTTLRCKIMKATELPKEFKTKYLVDLNGDEKTIFIARTNEANLGGPDRTVAMVNGYGEWYVFAPLTSITPAGYVFPGEPKSDIAEARENIVGYYEFMTMSFMSPKDINKDGKASTSYAEELNECQQDLLIDLAADNTGSWAEGSRTKNCKQYEQSFKWRLEDVIVKGKRVMTLFFDAGLDSKQFVVKELTRGRLVISGDFKLGTEDSTIPGSLELSRKKKKKSN